MIFQALKAAQYSESGDIAKQTNATQQTNSVWTKCAIAIGFSSIGGGLAIGLSQLPLALGQPPLVSLGLVFTGLLILLLR